MLVEGMFLRESIIVVDFHKRVSRLTREDDIHFRNNARTLTVNVRSAQSRRTCHVLAKVHNLMLYKIVRN